VTSATFVILLLGAASFGDRQDPPQATAQPPSQLRVFLDCQDCFSDYLRSEVTFVDYVRDRAEADVHVLLTDTSTGSGGREYTAAFIGLGRYAAVKHTLKAFTTSDDPDDVVRRQLATMIRVGLLTFVAHDGVPQRLEVDVGLGSEAARPAVVGDRWNNWVFSLRGSASFEGEESSRETQIGGSFSADRITPDWKMTFGLEFDHERERFDIDEDDPFEVERRERELNWLVVKGLGEHWSIGATGDVESSTFENLELSMTASPAIEYNFFPYSAYTRRQMRILYAIGPRIVDYYEETLFAKTEETLTRHELSATFEQRERWGTLDTRVEWSQYLHDLSLSRLEVDGEISWRLARGFSLNAEINASRIRDQLSLPRRGATPEEILLELRELQSGYDYRLSFGATYTFGSIFSSVVNPRFGQ
jgi:hypothetical protein